MQFSTNICLLQNTYEKIFFKFVHLSRCKPIKDLFKRKQESTSNCVNYANYILNALTIIFEALFGNHETHFLFYPSDILINFNRLSYNSLDRTETLLDGIYQN